MAKRGVAVAILWPKFTNFCAILDLDQRNFYPECNGNCSTSWSCAQLHLSTCVSCKKTLRWVDQACVLGFTLSFVLFSLNWRSHFLTKCYFSGFSPRGGRGGGGRGGGGRGSCMLTTLAYSWIVDMKEILISQNVPVYIASLSLTNSYAPTVSNVQTRHSR